MERVGILQAYKIPGPRPLSLSLSHVPCPSFAYWAIKSVTQQSYIMYSILISIVRFTVAQISQLTVELRCSDCPAPIAVLLNLTGWSIS